MTNEITMQLLPLADQAAYEIGKDIQAYATQAVTEDRAQRDAEHLAELRAYELTVSNLREQLAQPAQKPFPHEAMDKVASARYRIVKSKATIWPCAVVAGDGEQEIFSGSESTCKHVARKLAGAFLDGAFYAQAQLQKELEASTCCMTNDATREETLRRAVEADRAQQTPQVPMNHPDDQATAQLFLPCEPDGTPEGLAFTTRASAEEYARAVAADIGDGAREMRIADVTLVKAPTQVGHQGAAMTPDNLMKLIDDYACEVADTPSSPTPTERKLATERIERARKAVLAELAKPAPTQPAWHDQPTQPGLWLHRYLGFHEMWRIYDLTDSQGVRGRFFGPLPEDTK